jgi:hypothetical protein
MQALPGSNPSGPTTFLQALLAMREIGTPFRNAEQFINSQINDALEKYEEYKKANKTEK